MNSTFRLFGTLLLLCLAGFALFLAGCGSSSKTNSSQPMDVTTGTWTLKITPTSGTGGTITATFKTLSCSETNIPLGPDYTIPSISGTVCVQTTSISGMGSEAIVLGLGANPVPANSTTTITQGYLALQDSNGNYDAFDFTGTFTASSMSVSGTYTPDPGCINGCPEQGGGTFTGTMN